MANPFAELAAAAHRLEADAVVVFHKDLNKVVEDVKTALATAETDARTAVANAQPEIKAAVDQALTLADQAILAVLASHGL